MRKIRRGSRLKRRRVSPDAKRKRWGGWRRLTPEQVVEHKKSIMELGAKLGMTTDEARQHANRWVRCMNEAAEELFGP